jgi:hypothetical protein
MAFPGRSAMTIIQAPPVLYVGDPGQLIVTLDQGESFNKGLSISIDNPEQLAQISPSPNLVIQRIDVKGSTLTIDFKAFAPGNYHLPALRIAKEAGPLNISVASILEGETSLAGAESPLMAPGTMPLLYGAFFGLVFVIALAVVIPRWGLPSWRKWLKERKRQRRIHNFERELPGLREKPAAFAAEKINRSFRNLLAYLTGQECEALTPAEFQPVEAVLPGPDEKPGFYEWVFRCCDSLRFGPAHGEAGVLIDKLENWAAGVGSIKGAGL